MRTGILKIMQILFVIVFFACIFSNCEKPTAVERFTLPAYNSFRDIPGVTDDEIRAIEALREQRISFIYGTTPSTEAFSAENNDVNGFSALFCNWLTKLFGISFVPVIYTWGDLIRGLETFEIDFTGELTATDERRDTYIMTDTIAERVIKYFRISNSMPLSEIAHFRPLRYIFLEGTTTVNAVLPTLVPGTYEPIFINDSALAYDLLKSGKADAFINEGPGEANFDIYGDVVASDFLPLVYEPVSMTTQNPDLKPIISVVEKMLLAGGIRYLTGLYNQGHMDYIKHKFTRGLSDEERMYIYDTLNKVTFAAEPDNYPISFYNTREKEWQGITFDVINEIEALTGLRFERANDQYANFSALLKMLEDGRVSMISELIRSKEREGKFLWTATPILSSGYALISKSDYHNVNLNEVFYERVGLLKGTAHAALFRTWFPNHPCAVEYENADMAINALLHDEIDLIMARQTRLLDLTNYHEMVGYKANIVFDEIIGSSFGINKNDEILCSIINKSLLLIDTKGIADQWMRKTYDYRVKLVEAQRPWFIGVAGLFLCVLVLLFILFLRNRQEGRKLENLVEIRTGELRSTLTKLEAVTQDLEVAAKTAEAASLSKSQFLANMSHEIRTPMNAILGITEILLRNETLNSDIKEPLGKIYNSGDLLLNIINDILDLSKIEAGKLELAPAKYETASLINDTVTLNMMRIGSKSIKFKLSVDEKIPSTLFGDELRIKQILNNILSNAFKYTEEGEVGLSASVEQESTDKNSDMMFIFSVSDTGQGMTEDQVSKLFDEYSRFNMEANRTTEGTGLGMSITRNLIKMMNGEISVKSDPGKGSIFTVRLPQTTIGYSILGRELADNLQKFELGGGKQLRKAQIVYEPMPYGSILVVDDVESNLYVAQGLMSPYGLLIDTAISGFEAIEKIKSGKVYDIVFMDHMMPKMDGIEATKKMRELGYKSPVVALTANAVIGQSDVFIQNGFDDFISKPIDTRQLNSILKKLIRDKQPPEVVEAARQQSKNFINEDVQPNNVSRSAVSPRLAGFFINDAVKAIATLEAIHKKGAYEENDLQLYTINVHGMKSALANIGESELSAVAFKLEQAGRSKEMVTITAETPEFLNGLREIIKKLTPPKEEHETDETTNEDNVYLREKLLVIKTACETYDRKTVKNSINELQQKTWVQPVKEMLGTMSERLLDGDFEKVANIAEKIIEIA